MAAEPAATIGPISFQDLRDDDDETMFQSVMNKKPSSPLEFKPRESTLRPSLDPYIGKLERFELFSTNQCYYLVACDKHNLSYRVLKMDRTLIERPHEEFESSHYQRSTISENVATPSSESNSIALDAAHTAKPTLRPLSDFLTEDPHTYCQEEIQDMLDMIHHGNRYTRSDGHSNGTGDSGGGLKPLSPVPLLCPSDRV